MTLRGHIEAGRVVLDEPANLPDGTAVEVAVAAPEPAGNGREIPTLYEQLKDFVGAAKGLPADMAQNHDHYIHGTPKRREP